MQHIGGFIKNQREMRGISAEKLSCGLCHFTNLLKIENEKINADKFLIDVFLQRLGISEDFFEHYVANADNIIQEIRNDIIKKIDCGKIEQALILIREYKKLTNKKSAIHRQFCEYVKSMIMSIENHSIEDIIMQYEKAILITVPNFKKISIKKLLLSSIEINMILEHAMILEKHDRKKAMVHYLELLSYIQQKYIEVGIKVRVFPKIICIISKAFLQEEKYVAIINLCNIGIECLCNHEKLYGLINLLELKIKSMIKLNRVNDEYIKIKAWYDMLMEIYSEYGFNPNNYFTTSYLNFIWQDSYTIGEVVKKRRKMLGLSQEKLAEDICDYKTISRIENNRRTSYPNISRQLLLKLNLTGDLYSDNITYHDYEILSLSREITYDMSLNKYGIAREKLNELKLKLLLPNKINEQYIKYKEVVISEYFGEISIQEALEKLMRTLEITMSIDGIFESENRHFTKKELIIINSIVNNLEKMGQYTEMEKWMKLLEDYFKDPFFSRTHFSLYIFSKDSLQSIYGNRGEFDRSNKIVDELIIQSLEMGSFSKLDRLIYSIAWNFRTEIENKRKMTIKEKERYMKLLKNAHYFSEIKDDEFASEFYNTQGIE